MTPMQFIAYARKFCVALAAALAILAVSIEGGVTPSEMIQVGLAFAGALGVYTIPNTPKQEIK